jgi:hypothetical protein
MDIRLCVFPTDNYPNLIAYTTEYKVRDRIANQFIVLLSVYNSVSHWTCPYSICINGNIKFLPYNKGRAFEILLDYYSHRTKEGTIYAD